MVSHMKTTLVIEDPVMLWLKEEAARRNTTVSRIVEAALRRFLDDVAAPVALPGLPSFRGGRQLVDLSDRDQLYQAMEGR